MNNEFEKYVSDLNDLEGLIVGKKLGFGIHRSVYELFFEDEMVIKIANCEEGRANNQLEYKIWSDVEYTEYDKHFAKCYGVSTNGKYLIQERIYQKEPSKYPKEIPHFLTDVKIDNYGWDKSGNFKCCDYSLTRVTDSFSKRKKKIKEWY